METIRLGVQQDGPEAQCLWMQAGAVKRKMCDRNYECNGCRFDRSLSKAARINQDIQRAGGTPAGKREAIQHWKACLKELPVWKRPCVHHLKGKIGFRACTNDYSCGDCEFDQYFYDQYTVHAVIKPIEALNVQGFRIPQGVYLHEGHTWMKIEEGSRVRIGMDDFISRLFGPLDRVEAPLLGKELAQNRSDITIRRGAHQAGLLSPISGVVTAFNPRLGEAASLASDDPYAEGWIATLHATDLRRDLKKLMIGAESGEFLENEAGRLHALLEETLGPLAADGGYLGPDIFGKVPQLGWERLTRMFLSSP